MRIRIKSRSGRKMAAVMAAVMTMSLFAGCGGGGDSTKESGNDGNGNVSSEAVQNYVVEPIELVEGNQENTSISNVQFADGYIYYQMYNYPEYPQEFYDEMSKLDEKMGYTDSASSTMESDGDSPSDDAANDGKDSGDAASADKTSGDNKADKSDDADVSDDDLLGNVDDLFGDGKDDKKDDKKGDKKGDKKDSDKKDSDDSEISSYEELYEKYSDYKTTIGMYKYNIESKETTKIMEIADEEAEGYISTYCITKAGNLLILNEKSNYDDATMDSSYEYSLREIDKDGKELNRVDLNDKLGIKVGSYEEGSYIEMTKMVDEDKIVSKVGKTIYVYNSKGEVQGKVTLDGDVYSIAIDSEGNIVSNCYVKDKSDYYKIDVAAGKLGDRIEGISDGSEYSPYTLLDSKGGHSIYLKDSSSLYYYDYDSKEVVRMFKFVDIGLIGDYLNDMVPLDDGRIFYSTAGMEDANTNAGMIVPGGEADSTGKEVIKMMMMYSDTDVQKKIIEYNKADNKYKIDLITFENDDNPETSMSNQITSGNIPDVIDTTGLDVKNLVSKGLLEDMMPYVSSDDTVNEDFFVDGYLEATKEDGKLYYLANSFAINTIVGKKSELEKFKDGWTMKDLMEYYKSKPKGTQLFYDDTKTMLYYYLVESDLDSYIDWDAGTVSFDSDEFKSALEFCNTFPTENEDMSYDVKKNDYKDGKVLLRNEYVYNTETIQIDKKLFNDDYMYIGFPCKEGRGTYLSLSRAFGICAGSDKKDAAWDIVKLLTSDDSNYMGNIPTSKAGLEDVIKRDSATEKYKDENGDEVMPRESTYGFEDFEIKITPATKDEIETFRELIKSAKGVNSTSSAITEMVNEDVNQYFEGNKKLDEVVKVLQDKMTKYVNENK